MARSEELGNADHHDPPGSSISHNAVPDRDNRLLSHDSKERLRPDRPDRAAEEHSLNDLLPRPRYGCLELDVGRIERGEFGNGLHDAD